MDGLVTADSHRYVIPILMDVTNKANSMSIKHFGVLTVEFEEYVYCYNTPSDPTVKTSRRLMHLTL